MAVTCSVIVNTRNRATYLRRLLGSLGRLEGAGGYEVIVVDGESTDGTEAVARAAGTGVKYVRCGPGNLALSRNVGLREAGGDIAVFIDDDAIPADARWLARYREAFEEDTAGTLGAVGGATYEGDRQRLEFCGGMTSAWGEQRFNLDEEAALRPDGRLWTLGVVGNNCAFRRAALEAIGGFDEVFRYYLEETDVCLRLLRKGYRVLYRGDIRVRHYKAPAEKNPAFMRPSRAIARSDTWFALKNGTGPPGYRVMKTLRLARGKHFVVEAVARRQRGEIGLRDYLRFELDWARGLAGGLRAYLCPKPQAPPGGPGAFRPFAGPRPAKPLRICLLSKTLPPAPGAGGIARYTWTLAHELYRRGHEVHVICAEPAGIRHEALGLYVHGIGARPLAAYGQYCRDGRLSETLLYACGVACKLLELAAGGTEFDVIETPNWDVEGLVAAASGLFTVAMRVHTPAGEVARGAAGAAAARLRTIGDLERSQAGCADRLVASTGAVMETFAAHTGYEGEGFARVPVASGAPQGGTGGRPVKRWQLLFVGRLEHRKGVDLLLAVLPELLEAFPDWECHLVGDKSGEAGAGWVEAFRRGHGGSEAGRRVFFHDAVSDAALAERYAAASLVVVPSRYESFGLTLTEAMSRGLPVVAFRVGGIPEVVDAGVTGLLAEPGDAGELSRLLARLMQDGQLRGEMGAAAREAYAERFSAAVMGEAAEACYATLASEAAGKAEKLRGTVRALARVEKGESPAARRTAFALRQLNRVLREAGHGELEVPDTIQTVVRRLEQGQLAEAWSRVAAETAPAEPAFTALALRLAYQQGEYAAGLRLAGKALAGGAPAAEAELAGLHTCLEALLQAAPEAAAGLPVTVRARHEGYVRGHADELHYRARALIGEGEDGVALALLTRLSGDGLLSGAAAAEAAYHRASLLKRRGRTAEAREGLEALVCGPSRRRLGRELRGAAHYHLGELYREAGREREAQRAFRLCLRANPAHGKAAACLREYQGERQARRGGRRAAGLRAEE